MSIKSCLSKLCKQVTIENIIILFTWLVTAFAIFVIIDISKPIVSYANLNLELCKLQPKEKIDIEEFTESILNKINKNTYLGTFLLTGYDDCESCQEEFVGMTATGTIPKANHTIAVDPNIIPLGSTVIINGTEYVAEDVGGAINGYHIDIFMNSHEETFSTICNGYAEVYLRKE